MKIPVAIPAVAILLAAVASPVTMAQTQTGTQASSDAPRLLAAGSLRAAMSEVLAAFQASGGKRFETEWGPSGKLRKEIEAGKPADVFASASTNHTEALAKRGLMGPSQVFAYNGLCVVSNPEAGITADNLLEVLAQPSLRLATSTPGSDPMGDYTWQFFRNADKKQPGLYATFDGKAIKLSGTANLAPGATLPYITAFTENKADAYIMYCTNATLTKQAVPRVSVLSIPDELNVRSVYGISAGKNSHEGERLLKFVLSPQGQQILRKHGFN